MISITTGLPLRSCKWSSRAPSGRQVGAFTPQAIARSYMAALAQPPGAWSWEIEMRSRDEPF